MRGFLFKKKKEEDLFEDIDLEEEEKGEELEEENLLGEESTKSLEEQIKDEEIHDIFGKPKSQTSHQYPPSQPMGYGVYPQQITTHDFETLNNKIEILKIQIQRLNQKIELLNEKLDYLIELLKQRMY